MIKYNLYLTEEQDREIRKLSGTKSEHIRRAIDEYLERLKPKQQVVATSPSAKENNDEQ